MSTRQTMQVRGRRRGGACGAARQPLQGSGGPCGARARPSCNESGGRGGVPANDHPRGSGKMQGNGEPKEGCQVESTACPLSRCVERWTACLTGTPRAALRSSSSSSPVFTAPRCPLFYTDSLHELAHPFSGFSYRAAPPMCARSAKRWAVEARALGMTGREGRGRVGSVSSEAPSFGQSAEVLSVTGRSAVFEVRHWVGAVD